MAFAHGEILRRLNETPGTLGILFKIHSHPSSDPPALLEARADPAMSDLLLEHPLPLNWCVQFVTTRGRNRLAALALTLQQS